MSIHPQYARKILSGDKTVEFRRTRLHRDIRQVVIYATAPTGMLVGAFEIAGIDVGTATELWFRHGRQGGIAQSQFVNYFEHARQAVAIRIGRVFELPVPVPLEEFVPLRRPPQSYCYVGNDVFAEICRKAMASAATS
jgi:predicted transcriptional regulator